MKNLFKKITAAVLTAALTVTSLATGVFAAPTNKNYKHVDVELVGEAQIDGKPVQIKLDDKTVKMEFAGKTYTPNDSDPEDGAPRFEYKIPSNTEDSITITGNYTAFDTSDIVYKATDGYAYYKTETKSGSRFNKPSGEGWKYDGLGSFTWSRKVYAKVVKSDSFTMVFTPDTFEEARLNCPSHGGSYEGLDFKISLQDVIDPKYTVNWVVEGVIVETDENQKKDAEHVYNGETPVDNWSDPVVDEDLRTITYTAETPEETTTTTDNSETLKVMFYLRNPGQSIPTSGASIGTGNYTLIATDVASNVLSAEVDLSVLGNASSNWIENIEGVDSKYFAESYEVITSVPEEILTAYNLSSEDYEIVWYVIKKESDGVHVDGYIKNVSQQTETTTTAEETTTPVEETTPEETTTVEETTTPAEETTPEETTTPVEETTPEETTTVEETTTPVEETTPEETTTVEETTTPAEETTPEETTTVEETTTPVEETTPETTTSANTTPSAPVVTTAATTEEVVEITDGNSPAAETPTDSAIDGGNAEVTAEESLVEITDDDSAAGETPADSDSDSDNPHTADNSNIALVTLVALVSIIGAACALGGKDKLSAKK